MIKETPQTTDVSPLRTPFVRLTSRPNPFSSNAQLDYTVPSAAQATLVIYNVRGQRVRQLLDRRVTAGAHTATWDGRDDRGDPVAQGVYFATLRAGDEKRTHRLVLVK